MRGRLVWSYVFLDAPPRQRDFVETAVKTFFRRFLTLLGVTDRGYLCDVVLAHEEKYLSNGMLTRLQDSRKSALLVVVVHAAS